MLLNAFDVKNWSSFSLEARIDREQKSKRKKLLKIFIAVVKRMTKCTRKIDWLCKQVESVLLEVEANSKYLKWDLQGTNTLKLFCFN